MAASPATGLEGKSLSFSKRAFLKSANTLGKAYRNQAMKLICVCRVYSFSRAAEHSFSQDAALSDVLQACDDALTRITEAREKVSVKAQHWIELAIRKLEEYEEIYHPSKRNTPEGVRKLMNEAKNVDEEPEPTLLSRALSPSHTQRTRTPDASRVVKFHLLRTITDTQPTLVPQVLTNDPNLQEILWNFCRFPLKSEKRVTLAENPHFYHHHHFPIRSPEAYTTDPLDYYRNVDDIYVLTNMPGRVFLECDGKSRAFDNVGETDGIFIFKDVCGKLDSESIVGKPIQGGPCKWSLIEPSQPEVWVPVQNWREVIRRVLHSQNIKIRITN